MIYLRAYARGNLGDDLFIREICNKYKNEKIYLLADKKYKKTFKSIKNLKIKSYYYKKLRKIRHNHEKWLKLNTKILSKISKKCDTYIYVGGSIFIENDQTKLMPIKELKDEMLLFKKAYIIGANFGPYTRKEYLSYIHDELIPQLEHISFRDKDSYNLFKDLKNVSYAPDLIFSIKTNASLNKKNREVGFSLIHHLNREYLKVKYNNYINKLVELAINYIKQGYNIRLLSFCAYEQDPLAIEDFIKKIPEEYINHIKIDYYNNNIDSYLEIISKLEILVATRFHSIVLGIKNKCQVIPICYSNKSINLLNDLGINEYITFDNIEKLSELNDIKLRNDKLKAFEKESKKHYISLKEKITIR